MGMWGNVSAVDLCLAAGVPEKQWCALCESGKRDIQCGVLGG